MADQSITQLPVATSVNQTDIAVIVQGGVTKQTLVEYIANAISPGKLISNVVLLPNYDIEFFYSDGTTSTIGPIPGFTNAYVNGSGHLILVETDGTLLDAGSVIGPSGYSGISGYSGTNGSAGTSGYSGISGYSGSDGTNGASGFSGISGFSGYSGTSGYSGISGYSGSGVSGFSGVDGTNSNAIINGTSNVTISTNDGNVTVGVGGTSNVAIFTTTGTLFSGNIQLATTLTQEGGSPVAAGNTTISHVIPITINSATYYIALMSQNT